MSGAVFCPVGKLEKVLLATDRSEFSDAAVREAISFAARCSSKLYAMSVMETNPEYETLGSSLFEKEELELKAHLDAIKSLALKEGVDCETVVCHGNEPYKCIVDEATDRKVDMIVIGKRGTKGLMKLMIGEVAAKVIGYAPCKVLVVPKAAKIEYRTILIATDGSTYSDAAASEAIGIAKRCGSNIIALSSIQSEAELGEAQSNVNKILEIAKAEGIPAEGLTPRGRSYEVIVETAGGRGVDLIVVGTYGRTGFERILMGSSTERVIGLTKCGVLVVKSTRR